MPNSIRSRKVKDVMSRDVVAIHPQETIHEALELMVSNRISALPVINGKHRCVGIVSTTDLIELSRDLEDDLNELDDAGELNRRWLLEKLRTGTGHESVAEVMSDDIRSVRPDTPLRTAVREMLKHRVHHLPVLDEDQNLVGILSTMDILSAIADEK